MKVYSQIFWSQCVIRVILIVKSAISELFLFSSLFKKKELNSMCAGCMYYNNIITIYAKSCIGYTEKKY